MSMIIGPIDPVLLGNLDASVAVARFRELLLCEARYVGLRPDAITITSKIYAADGGIDAQIDSDHTLPTDTFLRNGRCGFQVKTGTEFKPWQKSCLKKELLSLSGELACEVRRTLEVGGYYFLICFGIDLTPKQRNNSRAQLVTLLAGHGFSKVQDRIEVFGQNQIAAYVERYPSLRLALMGGSDEDFFSVQEWGQNAHMSNALVLSEEQSILIERLRARLREGTKHLRLLGEPGIGKTRLVLEAVRSDDLAANTLYVEHGDRFSRTKLFREFLRVEPKYPIVLVIDELSEREMSEIWMHLKHRCGVLKLISIDHGPDQSWDSEIERFTAPRLPNQTVRAILAGHVGESKEIDRWISVCEGSPRVAQAVGENLAANPSDILRPPATVPIWERFLFGYARHQSDETRQIARVMRHIALFSRFGFEEPVVDEAKYIANLVVQAEPSVTWPVFQEIIQTMRERRVLQGAHTLFIVPWALHIHLWREYWHWHGRGFNFAGTFGAMPEALHGWFMEMFRYAHDSSADQIVKDILRPDGIFSNRDFLCSAKGTSFLSTLAEANPEACLGLIERTFGTWSREELLVFDTNRQKLVWALEKIAVWRPTVVRAIRMLARLALAENAKNSNNATGMLLGLFHIGPEWAATEASPTERLPALLEMLRSDDNDMKRLGLKVAEAALQASGLGVRIIGAEYQGVKERASLWTPETYSDWEMAYRQYWDCLMAETRSWNNELRGEANSAILEAAKEQLRITSHVEMVLSVIEQISGDPVTDMRSLNHFIIDWTTWHWHRDGKDRTVHSRLRCLNGKLARRSLESRFQRYVLDTTWDEWDDHELSAELREHTRPKKLVRALAGRVARRDEAFERLSPLLVTSASNTGALFAFGEAMCNADKDYRRLASMLAVEQGSKYSQCLGGYFNRLKNRDVVRWSRTLLGLLAKMDTAERGADLAWRSGVDDGVFGAWLAAFEQGWVSASSFGCLCYGRAWEQVPLDMLGRLFSLLFERKEQATTFLLVDLLDQVLTKDACLIDVDFVFEVVTAPTQFAERQGTMHAYHWHRVCKKMVARDPKKAMPLLDALLQQMSLTHHLSYDSYAAPFAAELCSACPNDAWHIVTTHLLSVAPKWRGELLLWLKGGSSGFDEKESAPPIALFPLPSVLSWISEDSDIRASMIAHCAPRSLDDNLGGALTRALLVNYRNVKGVASGISATFHSGGWSGPESEYLRKRRDLFRGWMGNGFEQEVVSWIEDEITYLDRQIEASEISEERESWRRPSGG